MAVKEVSVDLRWVRDKKRIIKMIYKAIGFEGEAGYNLDALHDVISAWGIPTRVTLKNWKRFSVREADTAKGIEAVLIDSMMENRAIIFAFK